MLVVQGNGAIGWAFIHQIPQVEERTEKTSQRTRKGASFMASPGRKKVASRLASKRKSGSTATEILESNRCRRERRSNRKGVRVGAEKRPNR